MENLTSVLKLSDTLAPYLDELLPIALFFGMFFIVFGLGGIVIRHMPRKSGSILDEVLKEEWDTPEQDEVHETADAQQISCAEENTEDLSERK